MMAGSEQAHGVKTPRRYRVLDLINTDKSAKELLDARVAQVNATGRYENAILCSRGEYVDVLRERGHTVYVIDTPRGVSPVGLLLSIGKTFALLRRYRFDVIHCHGSVLGVIGRAAALPAGTPIVIHQLHGFHHHEHMGPVGRRLCVLAERVMALVTDRLLFQNHRDVEECVRRRIAPSRKLALIGNGIQLDAFTPGNPPRNNPPVILCAARFEPVKNHSMLLEAASILRDRGIAFTLRLAGDGELMSACQAWVQDHGLDGHVEFLGYCDDVPALTAGAEVCTLASVKEGLPRAILEAGACGRPIVATDVVGNRDAIVDGVTGYLVPLGATDALADRWQALLRDAELRRRIGRQALAHAREHFDERGVTDRIIAVYDEMIGAV